MADTTIRVPEELADELFSHKQRGETYADVILRLLEDYERDRELEPDEQPTPEVETDPEPSIDIRGELEGIGLPGSGYKLEERIRALEAIHHHLESNAGEWIDTQTLKEIADTHDHGYSNVNSFWTNCVKKNAAQDRPNALVALPNVQASGDGEYRFQRA